MAQRVIRVALIDGPLSPDHPACEAVLDQSDDATIESPAGLHAAAVAGAILAGAPAVRIVSIPVFRGRLAAGIADLVSALELAKVSGAEIVHCSLGLARADPGVARAVAALGDRIVIASAPARGGPVWPAVLGSVIAVQGDARCDPAEWSRLGLATADYGACPMRPETPAVAGASLAAAHLTGIVAGLGAKDAAEARAALDAGAAFVGRERRTGP